MFVDAYIPRSDAVLRMDTGGSAGGGGFANELGLLVSLAREGRRTLLDSHDLDGLLTGAVVTAKCRDLELCRWYFSLSF